MGTRKLRWERQQRICYGTVPGEDEPVYICEFGEDDIWRAEGPGGVDIGWGELDDVQSYCQTYENSRGGD